MRTRSAIRYSAAAVVSVGMIAVAFLGVTRQSAVGDRHSRAVTARTKGVAPPGVSIGYGQPLACGQGQSPIYVVAQLSSSGTPADLTVKGLRVTVMGPPRSSRVAAAGSSKVVLMSPTDARGRPVSAQALRVLSAVHASEPVYPQSSDPSLLSCDYKLADRPRAQRLVSAAKVGIASARLATPAQMDTPSVMYLVSDDPLDRSDVIVTVYVRGAAVAVPGGHARAYQELLYVAFVSRSTATVTLVGIGPARCSGSLVEGTGGNMTCSRCGLTTARVRCICYRLRPRSCAIVRASSPRPHPRARMRP